MYAHVLWFSTIILGINVGWQPLPEGGMEYIIQLDPQTLEALKSGEPIQSDIPPGAGDVRSYKIVIGTEQLPRTSPFPRTLLPDQSEKRLTANSAAFVEPAEGSTKSPSTPQNRSDEKKEEPARPWTPLILVSLSLFASLGCNVYLTWIFADLRRRYRALSE